MIKACQRTSLIAALAMCSGFSEEGQRRRTTSATVRYSYYLPLIGTVYRTAFQTVFNISNDTITRHRNQVKADEFALPAHDNLGNQHAKSVDDETRKTYFTRLAETHRDIVPVRFRFQKPKDGLVRRYHIAKEYGMLPS
ncbi:hypothetical protein L917_04084 [Phytophthora nicotianae]|uniref:Uncharacterized protein n=3 Tax=Phytophthora nicotianae TaxID=4792 RepID=V9FN42_PHYNI|nr:hypothetical protein F443_04373 [Phytophthora nicotianae P1569]ETK92371.1 hypothetical protein L915_04252 [Phytophthora nicotianae]ETL98945.1 hypothetical protein L917_04084 [Phytophthora nicotianae]ETM52095.1 hypothetical protein L914_04197 [Phytophthora nicotianae]ETO81267.1 hypothetical protein F444_04391 [Phytophthora nicotianae P1976]